MKLDISGKAPGPARMEMRSTPMTYPAHTTMHWDVTRLAGWGYGKYDQITNQVLTDANIVKEEMGERVGG